MDVQLLGRAIIVTGTFLTISGFLGIILRMLVETGISAALICILIGILMVLIGLLFFPIGE